MFDEPLAVLGPSKIRILVVPLFGISRTRFDHYVSVLRQHFEYISLDDISLPRGGSLSSRTGIQRFENQIFAPGVIQLRYELSSQDSNEAILGVQPWKNICGCIGIAEINPKQYMIDPGNTSDEGDVSSQGHYTYYQNMVYDDFRDKISSLLPTLSTRCIAIENGEAIVRPTTEYNHDTRADTTAEKSNFFGPERCVCIPYDELKFHMYIRQEIEDFVRDLLLNLASIQYHIEKNFLQSTSGVVNSSYLVPSEFSSSSTNVRPTQSHTTDFELARFTKELAIYQWWCKSLLLNGAQRNAPGRAHKLIADIFLMVGKYEVAYEIYEHAIAYLKSIGDNIWIGNCIQAQSCCCLYLLAKLERLFPIKSVKQDAGDATSNIESVQEDESNVTLVYNIRESLRIGILRSIRMRKYAYEFAMKWLESALYFERALCIGLSYSELRDTVYSRKESVSNPFAMLFKGSKVKESTLSKHVGTSSQKDEISVAIILQVSAMFEAAQYMSFLHHIVTRVYELGEPDISQEGPILRIPVGIKRDGDLPHSGRNSTTTAGASSSQTQNDFGSTIMESFRQKPTGTRGVSSKKIIINKAKSIEVSASSFFVNFNKMPKSLKGLIEYVAAIVSKNFNEEGPTKLACLDGKILISGTSQNPMTIISGAAGGSSKSSTSLGAVSSTQSGHSTILVIPSSGPLGIISVTNGSNIGSNMANFTLRSHQYSLFSVVSQSSALMFDRLMQLMVSSLLVKVSSLASSTFPDISRTDQAKWHLQAAILYTRSLYHHKAAYYFLSLSSMIFDDEGIVIPRFIPSFGELPKRITQHPRLNSLMFSLDCAIRTLDHMGYFKPQNSIQRLTTHFYRIFETTEASESLLYLQEDGVKDIMRLLLEVSLDIADTIDEMYEGDHNGKIAASELMKRTATFAFNAACHYLSTSSDPDDIQTIVDSLTILKDVFLEWNLVSDDSPIYFQETPMMWLPILHNCEIKPLDRHTENGAYSILSSSAASFLAGSNMIMQSDDTLKSSLGDISPLANEYVQGGNGSANPFIHDPFLRKVPTATEGSSCVIIEDLVMLEATVTNRLPIMLSVTIRAQSCKSDGGENAAISSEPVDIVLLPNEVHKKVQIPIRPLSEGLLRIGSLTVTMFAGLARFILTPLSEINVEFVDTIIQSSGRCDIDIRKMFGLPKDADLSITALEGRNIPQQALIDSIKPSKRILRGNYSDKFSTKVNTILDYASGVSLGLPDYNTVLTPISAIGLGHKVITAVMKTIRETGTTHSPILRVIRSAQMYEPEKLQFVHSDGQGEQVKFNTNEIVTLNECELCTLEIPLTSTTLTTIDMPNLDDDARIVLKIEVTEDYLTHDELSDIHAAVAYQRDVFEHRVRGAWLHAIEIGDNMHFTNLSTPPTHVLELHSKSSVKSNYRCLLRSETFTDDDIIGTGDEDSDSYLNMIKVNQPLWTEPQDARICTAILPKETERTSLHLRVYGKRNLRAIRVRITAAVLRTCNDNVLAAWCDIGSHELCMRVAPGVSIVSDALLPVDVALARVAKAADKGLDVATVLVRDVRGLPSNDDNNDKDDGDKEDDRFEKAALAMWLRVTNAGDIPSLVSVAAAAGSRATVAVPAHSSRNVAVLLTTRVVAAVVAETVLAPTTIASTLCAECIAEEVCCAVLAHGTARERAAHALRETQNAIVETPTTTWRDAVLRTMLGDDTLYMEDSSEHDDCDMEDVDDMDDVDDRGAITTGRRGRGDIGTSVMGTTRLFALDKRGLQVAAVPEPARQFVVGRVRRAAGHIDVATADAGVGVGTVAMAAGRGERGRLAFWLHECVWRGSAVGDVLHEPWGGSRLRTCAMHAPNANVNDDINVNANDVINIGVVKRVWPAVACTTRRSTTQANSTNQKHMAGGGGGGGANGASGVSGSNGSSGTNGFSGGAPGRVVPMQGH